MMCIFIGNIYKHFHVLENYNLLLLCGLLTNNKQMQSSDSSGFSKQSSEMQKLLFTVLVSVRTNSVQ